MVVEPTGFNNAHTGKGARTGLVRRRVPYLCGGDEAATCGEAVARHGQRMANIGERKSRGMEPW